MNVDVGTWGDGVLSGTGADGVGLVDGSSCCCCSLGVGVATKVVEEEVSWPGRDGGVGNEWAVRTSSTSAGREEAKLQDG